jgi:hypothetical protein
MSCRTRPSPVTEFLKLGGKRSGEKEPTDHSSSDHRKVEPACGDDEKGAPTK